MADFMAHFSILTRIGKSCIKASYTVICTILKKVIIITFQKSKGIIEIVCLINNRDRFHKLTIILTIILTKLECLWEFPKWKWPSFSFLCKYWKTTRHPFGPNQGISALNLFHRNRARAQFWAKQAHKMMKKLKIEIKVNNWLDTFNINRKHYLSDFIILCSESWEVEGNVPLSSRHYGQKYN